MKLKEEISKRFLSSLQRLKGELSEIALRDFVLDYVLAGLPINTQALAVSSTDFKPEKFQLSFKDETYLVQASIILALMEASDNLKGFEKLHKKQKDRANGPATKKPDKKLSDFDKILEGIMKVPKEEKK